MNSSLLSDFSVNKENKTIVVKREFAADLELVWNAWTKAELLEQWWAPKPYYVQTISMNFSKGGLWHYAMVSPEGQKHYCKAYYQDIELQRMFSYKDAFCNEKGQDLTNMPSMQWNNTFISQNEDSTIVNVVLTFETEEVIENIIKMGMKEGFTMALTNLDELIAKIKQGNEQK
jgi:uncharacterized protein YndB with AHSA1/START domain